MTEDEILNMPAGREMDALIAEKVMGWRDLEWIKDKRMLGYREPDGGLWGSTPHQTLSIEVPFYSTDISAAWEVVEKLRNRVWSFTIGASILYDFGWAVEWKNKKFVHEKSLPLVTCRAALLAVNS